VGLTETWKATKEKSTNNKWLSFPSSKRSTRVWQCYQLLSVQKWEANGSPPLPSISTRLLWLWLRDTAGITQHRVRIRTDSAQSDSLLRAHTIFAQSANGRLLNCLNLANRPCVSESTRGTVGLSVRAIDVCWQMTLFLSSSRDNGCRRFYPAHAGLQIGIRQLGYLNVGLADRR
jgi:hypothetical protein